MLKIFSVLAVLALSCAQTVSAQALVDFDRGAAAVLSGDMQTPAVPAVPSDPAQDSKAFRLKLSGYPASEGPCVESARRIGEAIAKSAGVEILNAACESAEGGAFNIVINYSAPERLETIATVSNGSYMGGLGSYATEQACRDGLAAEKAVFQDRTGLEPAYAYCFAAHKVKSPFWTMNIGALGSPKIRPFNSHFLTFTMPFVSKQEFLAGIKANLLAQGVDVREVVWVADFGYAMINATYYAAERLKLDSEEVAKLSTREHCEAMLAETRMALAGRPQPLDLSCGKSMMSDYEVSWVFKNQAPLALVKHDEGFNNYAACDAARGRVSEFYTTSMGHKVLGADCTNDIPDYNWKVILLEEKF